jgi:GH24 family phage-related lysozyme (muramidase)
MSVSIESIDPASLSETERNGLAILENLSFDHFGNLKRLMSLSEPGIVGPQTLAEFVKLCRRPDVGIDLTDDGVNRFKDEHQLGNSGTLHGVIGPQTASFYYSAVVKALQPGASAGGREIDAAGLALIKEFEGYDKLVPGTTDVTTYLDQVGVPTIGWGHTGPDVEMGLVITMAEAERLLRDDLVRFETAVSHLVTVTIDDNQFAALVSFAFNLGADALRGSTLLALLNAGHADQAADQFGRWVYAGHAVAPGLVRRRAAERALFLS